MKWPGWRLGREQRPFDHIAGTSLRFDRMLYQRSWPAVTSVVM
jgi:hypothetical protein